MAAVVKNPMKDILKTIKNFTEIKAEVEAGLKTNILHMSYDRSNGHKLTIVLTWAENMTVDDIEETK